MRFALVTALVACACHPGSESPSILGAPTRSTSGERSAGGLPATGAAGTAASSAVAASATRPVAAATSAVAAGPAAAATTSPEPASCIDDGSLYDPASLRARVAYLASAELDGRATGTAGDAAARAHIAERFRCLGLLPGGAGGSYEQPFTADGRATANVIGYVAGDDPVIGRDVIVVGAHHDHVGLGHLGANDNASGIAALLAIAQAVRRHGAPHRTLAFVAFASEELGLLGSAHFAAHPPDALPLERVVYDINLDMVGSYASAGAVYAMGTFHGLAATPIVQSLTGKHRGLHVGIGGRGSGSDHMAFCRQGVPYVFFWTPDKRCYHRTCDTVDALDAIHLAQIAELAGELVERLAHSSTDLAAARTRLGCTGSRR